MSNDSNSKSSTFGNQDASYRAAGGLHGLTRLVDAFYRHMEVRDFSKKIFEMHSSDIATSREKLTYFLSGWLGGPRLYQEKYGSISIPGSHQHLNVGPAEKDAWLKCMQLAIDEQGYKSEFSEYLLIQLSVPANRVEAVCQRS